MPRTARRRNIAFANTVHSPSSIVKADDNETYARVQTGVGSTGGEWVNLQRGAGAPPAKSDQYVNAKTPMPQVSVAIPSGRSTT